MTAPSTYLNAMGVVCAAAGDAHGLRGAITAMQPSGVDVDAQVWPGHPLPLGVVRSPLADVDALPWQHRSRNNAMLLTALAPIRAAIDAAIARHGPHRIGICLGTSTSGISESERALVQWHDDGSLPDDYHVSQQEFGSPALALAGMLDTGGPLSVVSTACSSGAKALASAARWLRADICDAVICGGVDTLCAMTVAGFSALEAVSTRRCNPFSANRDGINIGEGAALFVMSREPGPVRLAGWGETSDAHHISAPDPTGRGAAQAMSEAIVRAGIEASLVDYINLHGTATLQNDAMEATAVAAIFADRPAVSSTKPLTGHTLGAAGAIEAAICWAMLCDNPQGLLPGHFWDGDVDPALPALNIAGPGSRLGRPLRFALSNSFAFGGSNASLLFAAA